MENNEKKLNEILKEKTSRPVARIELVEDRLTGTLYEMNVYEEETIVCPVIKESKK